MRLIIPVIGLLGLEAISLTLVCYYRTASIKQDDWYLSLIGLLIAALFAAFQVVILGTAGYQWLWRVIGCRWPGWLVTFVLGVLGTIYGADLLLAAL